MSREIHIHVDESLDAIGDRAIAAGHRIDRGEVLQERHVGFETWETMVRVLSAERLGLLRHLHRTPADGVGVLALAVGRDNQVVHEDVDVLVAAGLLVQDEGGLRVDYDALHLRITVAL